MKNAVKVRNYLYQIADAIVENYIKELHLITQEATVDYTSDNITYKELHVIMTMTNIGTVVSIINSEEEK